MTDDRGAPASNNPRSGVNAPTVAQLVKTAREVFRNQIIGANVAMGKDWGPESDAAVAALNNALTPWANEYRELKDEAEFLAEVRAAQILTIRKERAKSEHHRAFAVAFVASMERAQRRREALIVVGMIALMAAAE